MSIFSTIKSVIVNLENERDFGKFSFDREFAINQKDWRVLTWFEDNKVFTIKKLDKEGKSYIVHYDNLDPENQFFKHSGLRSRQTVDNSDYRYYTAASTATDDYMYEDAPKLGEEDHCLDDFILASERKWDNFEDFKSDMTAQNKNWVEELRILREKYEPLVAEEWEF